MLKTTLLILTMIPGEAPRVTLSAYDSAEECEAARDVVSQILTEAGQEPQAALCGETGLRVTPYVHGAPRRAEVNHYRIELPAEGGFTVAALQEGEVCEDAHEADPAVWCAVSAQHPISVE